jgi:phage tail-like protein
MIGDLSAARRAPLHVFNFEVKFFEAQLTEAGGGPELPLLEGAFAEVSGLEATMEAKSIREGGLNGFAHQRPGAVTFATVIFRRGVTRARDLARAFEVLAGGAYAKRLDVLIELRNGKGAAVLRFKLLRALPVKFKAADLSARATEVGVEELHLVHEGLEPTA